MVWFGLRITTSESMKVFAVQEVMAEDMAYREAVEYLKGQDFKVNFGALEDV